MDKRDGPGRQSEAIHPERFPGFGGGSPALARSCAGGGSTEPGATAGPTLAASVAQAEADASRSAKQIAGVISDAIARLAAALAAIANVAGVVLGTINTVVDLTNKVTDVVSPWLKLGSSPNSTGTATGDLQKQGYQGDPFSGWKSHDFPMAGKAPPWWATPTTASGSTT